MSDASYRSRTTASRAWILVWLCGTWFIRRRGVEIKAGNERLLPLLGLIRSWLLLRFCFLVFLGFLSLLQREKMVGKEQRFMEVEDGVVISILVGKTGETFINVISCNLIGVLQLTKFNVWETHNILYIPQERNQ